LYELVAVQPQNLVTIKSWLEKKQAMGAMGCLDTINNGKTPERKELPCHKSCIDVVYFLSTFSSSRSILAMSATLANIELRNSKSLRNVGQNWSKCRYIMVKTMVKDGFYQQSIGLNLQLFHCYLLV